MTQTVKRALCRRCRSGDLFVFARYCNYSAFNGYHRTPSDYSGVSCRGCGKCWRTKAAYVNALPDGDFDRPTVTGATR